MIDLRHLARLAKASPKRRLGVPAPLGQLSPGLVRTARLGIPVDLNDRARPGYLVDCCSNFQAHPHSGQTVALSTGSAGSSRRS